MIIHWPNKQSIDLNLAVSHLFTQTYRKFFFSLSNKTNHYLAFDIFSQYTKKQMLIEVLIELEILIIDIIELNLNVRELEQLSSQILLHLINATFKRLFYRLQIQTNNLTINFCLKCNKLFFYENSYAAHILFTYLVFGSESISCHIFPFANDKTPFYHIKVLFENIIIQTANIITFNLLENSKSVKKIYSLVYSAKISYRSDQSIRKISDFKNNLMSCNLINLYIHYPQNIYCSRYAIHLLSPKGIISKHIYFNRVHEYIKLSNCQLGSVIYLEAQDFIIPRLNRFIILIGRLIIYIFTKIISKNFNKSVKNIYEKLNIQKY